MSNQITIDKDRTAYIPPEINKIPDNNVLFCLNCDFVDLAYTFKQVKKKKVQRKPVSYMSHDSKVESSKEDIKESADIEIEAVCPSCTSSAFSVLMISDVEGAYKVIKSGKSEESEEEVEKV